MKIGAACSADPAPGQAAEQLDLWKVKGEHSVQALGPYGEKLPKGLSLRDRPREAVQNKPLLAIGPLESLCDQTDDHFVGNQGPGIHGSLGFHSKWGPSGHSLSQHVPGGDARDPIPLRDHLGLSPFPDAGES